MLLLTETPAPAVSTATLGQIAGLSTALCWALCSLAFGLASRRIGSTAVNYIRIVIATGVLAIATWVTEGSCWPALSTTQFVCLAASGIAGLALGDVFLFRCIELLGPRVGTLLMATVPIWAALIAWPILDEPLHGRAVLGIVLTLAGVAIVVARRSAADAEWGDQPKSVRRQATCFGLLAALGQASGLILAKLVLDEKHAISDPDAAVVTPLGATMVRMTTALVTLSIVLACFGHARRIVRGGRDLRAMALLSIGVVFGPTLGVWLSLVAVQNVETGIAATLMATAPIFMLPVAWFGYRSRAGLAGWLGAILAVAGSAVLLL